jgi:tRNA (cmo5U34)-methyltransferase
MIEIAKHNLNSYSNIEFIVGDFSDFDFNNEYDAVVSSLAIHHIDGDQGKKDLYTKIFNSLKDNGVFFNADVVLGSSEFSRRLNKNIWVKNLKKNFSTEETKEFSDNQEKIDKPSKLVDQLEWLEAIGFKDIDITWKYYGHAVYGGKR